MTKNKSVIARRKNDDEAMTGFLWCYPFLSCTKTFIYHAFIYLEIDL